jgi:hypothetical protein
MKIIIKAVTVIIFFMVNTKLAAQVNQGLLLPATLLGFNAANKIIEVRCYNLKPGTRADFNKLFVEKALPLLNKYHVEVVAFGASQHDSDSYFLMRSYKSLEDMQQSEDNFYGSDDWRKGLREAILAPINNYTTVILPAVAVNNLATKITNMNDAVTHIADSTQLSALNAKFIRNFLTQDVAAHDEIIHKDFVCIESDGTIVPRNTYLQHWATDFDNSGYTSFSYQDELIRIFGSTALVRAKTVYTKNIQGKVIKGYTIYTDTYVKENGKWQCVQVQITPAKTN